MDNPRVLLAIALSFLVMLIWQAWMEDYGPQPKPGEQIAVTETPAVSESGEDLPVAPDDRPPTVGEEDVPVQLPAGQRVEVVTDMFRAVIDTRGGDLREVDLLHYMQSPEEGSEAFRLLEESANQLFIAQSGLRATKGPEPTHHADFQVDQNRFELADDADVLEVPLPNPFPRMTHAEAMDRFGSDKPDLRIDMELVDIGDLMVDVEFKVFSASGCSAES